MFDYRGISIPVWGKDFMAAGPAIDRAVKLNANGVALVPHLYVDTADPYEGTPIYQGPNTASHHSLRLAIQRAHGLGLRVMLKPHVDWIREGGWRGWFWMANEAARQAWDYYYRSMMRDYARIAMEEGVEVLCIGCEFTDLNKDANMALVWLGVIADVRGVGYTGKLTYAANWGPFGAPEYNSPGLEPVWPFVDFIGVDAYYPLSTAAIPTLKQLTTGWYHTSNPWAPEQTFRPAAELMALHHRHQKPVVFTEVGYPATNFTGYNPGGAPESLWMENQVPQADAYRAVFDVWKKVSWMHGAFFWQDGPVRNSHSFYMRRAGAVLKARYGQIARGE